MHGKGSQNPSINHAHRELENVKFLDFCDYTNG